MRAPAPASVRPLPRGAQTDAQPSGPLSDPPAAIAPGLHSSQAIHYPGYPLHIQTAPKPASPAPNPGDPAANATAASSDSEALANAAASKIVPAIPIANTEPAPQPLSTNPVPPGPADIAPLATGSQTGAGKAVLQAQPTFQMTPQPVNLAKPASKLPRPAPVEGRGNPAQPAAPAASSHAPLPQPAVPDQIAAHTLPTDAQTAAAGSQDAPIASAESLPAAVQQHVAAQPEPELASAPVANSSGGTRTAASSLRTAQRKSASNGSQTKAPKLSGGFAPVVAAPVVAVPTLRPVMTPANAGSPQTGHSIHASYGSASENARPAEAIRFTPPAAVEIHIRQDSSLVSSAAPADPSSASQTAHNAPSVPAAATPHAHNQQAGADSSSDVARDKSDPSPSPAAATPAQGTAPSPAAAHTAVAAALPAAVAPPASAPAPVVTATPAAPASTQAKQSAAPTVNMPEIHEPPAPGGAQQQPLRSVSLEFTPDGARDVRVRLSERGGDVHISLHASDPALTGRLREGVQDLAGALHSAGYDAEAHAGQDSNNNAGGRQAQDQQQQHQQRRRPNPTNTGEDFGGMMPQNNQENA